MDLTPQVPRGRFVIEAYGDGRFRIAGAVHAGSVLVSPSRVLPWPAVSLAALSPRQIFDQIAPLWAAEAAPEILLIGCGARMAPVPAEARAMFKEHRIAVEAMDTGAACRTYNVLVMEDRLVAAALIAV